MSGSQYIKATIDNLRFGHVVIRYKEGIGICGPIMICMNSRKSIEETKKVFCCTFKKSGLLQSRWINISELARLMDHKLARKLMQEEIFES